MIIILNAFEIYIFNGNVYLEKKEKKEEKKIKNIPPKDG